MFAHNEATSKDGTTMTTANDRLESNDTRARPQFTQNRTTASVSTAQLRHAADSARRTEHVELPKLRPTTTSKSRNVGVQVESLAQPAIERHEKSTETDNSLDLSSQKWSSPLTLSVDTGINTTTTRGSPTRRLRHGDNGQGILAVAINAGDIGIPIVDSMSVRTKLPSPGKERHVTFSSSTGDDREEQTNVFSSHQRFPRSFSYAPNVNFALVRDGRQVSTDFVSREDEEFIDGDYFFNHLIPQREADEYKANLLRYQRRNADDFTTLRHGRRIARNGYTDRLSTSLPADYFLPNRGYFYYDDKRPVQSRGAVRIGRGQRARHEMPFAGGMELEIPLRRHGGLGGGGLRQSISADPLQSTVPRSHRDRSSQFGKRFFRSSSAVVNDGFGEFENEGRPDRFQNGSSTTLMPGRDVDNAKDVLSNPLLHYGNVSQESSNRERRADLVSSNRFDQVPQKRFEKRHDSELQLSLRSIESNRNRNAVLSQYPTDRSHFTDYEQQTRVGGTFDDRDRTTSRFLSQSWNEHGLPSPRFHRPENERLSMSWDQSRFHSHLQFATTPNEFATSRVDLKRSLQLPLHVQSSPHIVHHDRRPESQQRQVPDVLTNRKAVSWQDPEVSIMSAVDRGAARDRSPSSDGFQSELRAETRNREGSNEISVSPKINGSPSSRSFEMSDLDNIDQFALFEISTSSLGWGQSFMGTSWIDSIKQYKFVVLNRYEEVLFFGIEESGSISNGVMGPHKSSFKVRILNANGEDVIQFQRLYPVKSESKFTFGKKQKYRLEVSTSSGHVIGNVEKTFDSDTYYVLEDRAGECLFIVQKSCICTCPLFWDYEFKVLLPGTDADIGDISWSYLTAQEERFNGTEISFPVDLDTKSKLMLLGVCFLLNFSRWPSRYLESVFNPRNRSQKTKPKKSSVESNVNAINNKQRTGNVAANSSHEPVTD